MVKTLFLWFVIAMIVVSVFYNFGPKHPQGLELTYSQFLNDIDQGNVASVTIEEQNITGVLQDKRAFATYMPMPDPYLLNHMMKKDVAITGKPPEQRSLFLQILISLSYPLRFNFKYFIWI